MTCSKNNNTLIPTLEFHNMTLPPYQRTYILYRYTLKFNLLHFRNDK